ncbi:HIT domain-containing protein [Candidatus Woesearchaeota archaeon]|jgi:histidine triad (HIT) family protein|nr:HIT domain-containing protein [Candidatus Woesearchaeota archaeon]
MELSPEQQEALEQQKQQCIFCQIVSGKIPGKKIYENEHILAFMDIRPATKGHVLLIPKEHYFIMPVIPPEIFKQLMIKVRDISKSMKDSMLSDYTTAFIANGGVAGQQIPHVVIHLIPREKGDGLNNFEIPEKPSLEADVSEVVQKVKPILNAMLDKNLTMLGYKGSAGGESLGGQNNTTVARGDVGVSKELGKEQIVQIINQNPQLKEIILKQPDQFKQLVPTHPQLKDLFKNVDLDEIIALVSGKPFEKKETEPSEQSEEKENLGSSVETKTEKKDDANLDLVSKLFG